MWISIEPLLPLRCAGCDAPGTAWCPACDAELEPFAVPSPPGVRRCAALAGYDSGAGRALRRAKYGADRAAMVRLAQRFASLGAPLAHGHDAIVPVPSPWPRMIRRGFSPSAVLASALARAVGLPLVRALRIAPGRRQAGLGARERASNLAGRLEAIRAVQGRILVIDDVLTTGATAAAAARELLGGEALAVTLLVLCATDRGPA